MTKDVTKMWQDFTDSVPMWTVSLFGPRNHINHSDLFDTIRHEAIHVVQACNGWDTVLPVSDYAGEVTSEMAKTLADYPQDTKTQSLETEAYVPSAHLSEQQVINLINKYCFE